jgi:photosystem II stability/assembly factor-like uncharacterized protein
VTVLRNHYLGYLTLIVLALATGCVSPAPVWQAHNEGLPTGAPVLALAGDPMSPQTLLAATYDAHGLYRSEDGGATWAPVVHGLPPRPVHALLVSSAHPGIVLAGTGDGLYRSTDGGATWRHLLADPAQLPFAIYAFSQDEGGVIYLGGDQNRLWRSDDGGATWVPLASIAGELSVLSLAHSSAGDLLLAGSDRNGVYLSADRGGSWQRSDGMDRTAVADLLVPEPDDSRPVLARGRQGLWRSDDGGRTWEPVPITVRGRVDALGLAGAHLLFLTNEGNLYRSSDQG